MATRSMQDWLDAYGVSHQNPTNKAIHWICVPTIYFCVVGFLWSIPTPETPYISVPHTIAMVAIGLVAVFYLRLSLTIMVGMMGWSV
ncbi:MAG: DUF962 domain-containing protein, partial [Flavobacteriales bacterium]|nr:DUF962 domain-containing protein [Flavobacteriales bacterium]